MIDRRDRPPRVAAWLLAAALPPTLEGRSARGDLFEEYHLRPRGLRRRAWFWVAAVDLVIRYLPVRLGHVAQAFRLDLTHAARFARRTPALTTATIVTLSLAIGASTAAFSVANGSWLRPLLAADSSVVLTWRMRENGGSRIWPAGELLALRQQVSSLTIEGAVRQTPQVGAARDAMADAPVSFVTDTYLQTFRAEPFLGRGLGAGDATGGAAPVAVISHLYWRRHFGGDRDVLGRTIWLEDSPFAVVGVTGRDFIDPSLESPVVWVPLQHLPQTSTRTGDSTSLFMLSRLRHGVTPPQADGELTRLLPGVAGLSAGAPAAVGAESGPVAGPDFVATFQHLVFGTLAVIALVLVLACANVSNLQLAGAATRSREIAIRYSCGATRWRVVRQLATESAAAGVIAGLLGFALARLAAPAMAVGMGLSGADVDIDLRTFAFAFVVTLAVTIGTGFMPALQGSRRDLSSDLKSTAPGSAGGPRSSRTTAIFLGVQAAASVVIVGLSALLVRSMVHIAWIGPGYDLEKLVNVSVPFGHDDEGRARASAFWPVALERVRALPGVEAASLAFGPPFGMSRGDPDEVFGNPTDATYFETIGLRIVAGRTYTAAEVTSRAPVAVLSEEVARRFWRGETPIGSMARRVGEPYRTHVVIGVVGDAMALRVHARGAAAVYTPGVPPDWAKLTVRAADPAGVVGPLRDLLRSMSPESQPTVSVVADRFGRELVGPRRRAALAGVVIGLTVVLCVVGLAGVTMFAVHARTREIAVRLALGARRQEVMRLLLRDGLRAVLIGLALGVVGALGAGRYASSLLYGLSAHDPLALTGAVLLLLATAATAVLIPARRAAALDPAVVLRDG